MNRRPLTILSVAYPLFPVSEDSSGGAEQILHLLERGLVQAGHRSFVIAAQGSQVSGTLIATRAAGSVISDSDRQSAQRQHRESIDRLLAEEKIDIIHFHGLDFPAYLPASTIPVVATLHLPLSWYSPEIFELNHACLVCVSKSQASSVSSATPFQVIGNGIDVPIADPGCCHRESLLWIGRICPEKGTDIALRVARKLDIPLTVAGPVHGFASHLEYFQQHVEPLLDQRRIYIGPVGRQQKLALLGQSRAVLIPGLAPETSSLVAMEACSVGTPAIALPHGALPEIVEDGVTGFIAHSEEEMAAAVGRVGNLSRSLCIQRAKQRFSAQRMVDEYLSLYQANV